MSDRQRLADLEAVECIQQLEDLDKSASAKLKIMLPLIPAIASYELEMDTEGLMYKTWSINHLVAIGTAKPMADATGVKEKNLLERISFLMIPSNIRDFQIKK